MRLSVSGTAAQGKTTLLKEFLKHWNMYDTPDVSYRSLIKSDNHSKKTNKETQWNILNHMIDDMEKYGADDHVIFDRCPLDNLVYSMWAFHKDIGDIDELFIEKCIPVVRESMRLLDIILLIPITNAAPEQIDDNGVRETDTEYIKEIDNMFKAMYNNWYKDDTRFFPKEDRTAIVEIFGTTEERISMLSMYINDKGNMFGEDDSLVDTNQLYDQYGFKVGQNDDSTKIYE